MSFRKLVAGVTFMAIAAMTAKVTIASDTFWHLAAGRWILEHGQILRVDPFSLSQLGEPWVYPGWLAQILLFAIYQAFGFPGLNLFTMSTILLTFGLIWRAMEEPALVRAFVIILAASASGIFWSARPQLLTLLLAAAFLLVLERRRRTGRTWQLWLLPMLMALWSNLHGGFIAGFLFLAAYIGGELSEWFVGGLVAGRSWTQRWGKHQRLLRDLGLILVVCLVAVAANPFGPQMLLYPFETVSLETLSNYIQEWQSPNFHMRNTWPFLALLLLVPVSFGFSNKRLHASELLLYLGFGALALHSARNIALFAVGASLLLARHFNSAVKPIADAIGSGREVPAAFARWLNLAAFLLLGVALALWAIPRISSIASAQAIERDFPVRATDYLLEDGDPGPVFHTYRWGGYLIWRGTPELKSFVDGRTDLFGDELLGQYLLIYQAGHGFQSFIERWGFDYALIEPGAPLAAAAERLGWKLLLETEIAHLYAIQ